MEFGSPPLYYEINRMCREKDVTHIKELGPFIFALTFMVAGASKNRPDD